MAISDKTQKTLWARSGNRCAICRIELVQEVTNSELNLIIGQQCHIISEAQKGPRSNPNFNNDYDAYGNLILLCSNDHKRIDDLTDIYTVDKLKNIKRIHENWVKNTLEKDVSAFANDEQNVKSLPLIKSGKQLLDIVKGVHMADFDNEELKTIEEAEKVGSLFDLLKEYIDILDDIKFSDLAKIGIQLNDKIVEIENLGFLLFGMKRNLRMKIKNGNDIGAFETASLVIVRKNNPSIISDFLIAKFPTKVNFGL